MTDGILHAHNQPMRRAAAPERIEGGEFGIRNVKRKGKAMAGSNEKESRMIKRVNVEVKRA